MRTILAVMILKVLIGYVNNYYCEYTIILCKSKMCYCSVYHLKNICLVRVQGMIFTPLAFEILSIKSIVCFGCLLGFACRINPL